MRKIFILGGSDLQLDLILEAKKMFFYTIVIDANNECIGKKYCDEFLLISIADKELVLSKAIEYGIDVILTSATEVGNLTACYVGEKLNLNTNTYTTALDTTNKIRMKKILVDNGVNTAHYQVLTSNSLEENPSLLSFPCVIKPADSSAGRGLSYVDKLDNASSAVNKALSYSSSKQVLLEEYIDGRQFSVETVSCEGHHQILAINEEFIREVPNILEYKHVIPADCSTNLKIKIVDLVCELLDIFKIVYGACHIELRVTEHNVIYVVELASRTGGMRSEMINIALGISYSQVILFASLGQLSRVSTSREDTVECRFIVDFNSYNEYLAEKQNFGNILFESKGISRVDEGFIANNLGESKGYYYIMNP